VIRPKIWIYWVFTGASTVAVFAWYFVWSKLRKRLFPPSKESDEESRAGREKEEHNGKAKQN
jgi:hypothetical protein